MSQKRFHLLCRLLTTWDQQCSTGDSVVYDRVEINTLHDILVTNFGLPLTGCIGFIWNSLCTSGTSVNKKKHTMNPEPCQCLTSENKKCSEFFRECFYNCVWYVIRWGIKSFMSQAGGRSIEAGIRELPLRSLQSTFGSQEGGSTSPPALQQNNVRSMTVQLAYY